MSAPAQTTLRRGAMLVVALVIIALVASRLLPRAPDAPPEHGAPTRAAQPTQATASVVTGGSPLAAELNAPGFDTAHDLRVLSALLGQFTTLYKPAQRRPLGDNIDITAALTGANAQRIVFIPANHPAVRARDRQLIDRWGTPYVFHARSADAFDLRSAGPDRQLYTDDDVTLPFGK